MVCISAVRFIISLSKYFMMLGLEVRVPGLNTLGKNIFNILNYYKIFRFPGFFGRFLGYSLGVDRALKYMYVYRVFFGSDKERGMQRWEGGVSIN